MPGISDRKALKRALIDIYSGSDVTIARMSNKGIKDTCAATRLRASEMDIFKTSDPALHKRMTNLSHKAVLECLPGNHFVYRLIDMYYNIYSDKRLVKKLRDNQVVKSVKAVGPLMAAKCPSEGNMLLSTHLPEHYGKLMGKYVAARTFVKILNRMYSESGKSRSKLQDISRKAMSEDIYKERLERWIKDNLIDKSGRSVKVINPFLSSRVVDDNLSIRMIRLSDVIYLEITYDGNTTSGLLTPVHYERFTTYIKQLSNIELGTYMGYAHADPETGMAATSLAMLLMRKMVRIGVNDDLLPGEAAKAASDMYKAKISQTDELPFNNLSLLKQTYSESRLNAAEELYEMIVDAHLDIDISINVSFVWKTAIQADSDILKDFEELSEALTKPNPIKQGATDILECSVRRSLLIGAIRDNRQAVVEHSLGLDLPPEVARVLKSSNPTEHDIRMITAGSMKNLKVKVPDVFPDVSDVTHLGFKDKSSAVEGEKLQKQIIERSSVISDLEHMEDEMISSVASENSNIFFKHLSTLKGEKSVDKALYATANDIVTSIDESLVTVFKEAEKKFHRIVKSIKKLDKSYGDEGFLDTLREWARENPDLLINTATEPKLGEVHKRSVRIFYMFEKSMKTFLSQFERLARILDHYIKGAEIVKGDRAREKHMNILSSAFHAGKSGVLAYQILFDLSKFSQKFHHKLIDAVGKVIGEAVDYPDYANISDLFKAAFLFVSARGVHGTHIGVLGAFEGFLNFLWTGIHASVMDIALKECGRSGDLAAFSDDGLLLFVLLAILSDGAQVISLEIREIIDAIKSVYKDFGLDFNLGKTIISRVLSEFLGVIMYQGRRIPTWMKELSSLGTSDEDKTVTLMCQSITDTSAQYTSLLKGGMPPYAATLVSYMEICVGPVSRLFDIASSVVSTRFKKPMKDLSTLTVLSFLCLPSSFGGCRIPDVLTSMTTADFDPTSESLQDIVQLSKYHPEVSRLFTFMIESIHPSNDYTNIFMGSSPINTEGASYGISDARKTMMKFISKYFNKASVHPLSPMRANDLHRSLEGLKNIYLPIISSMCRCIVPLIEYERLTAPSRSSAMRRLLTRWNIRAIQSADTHALRASIYRIAYALNSMDEHKPVTTEYLMAKSYPRLDFAKPIDSYRVLSSVSRELTECSYILTLNEQPRANGKGSYRLMNREYEDELSPPLVTTDINLQYITSAPDLITHCCRILYSEVISATSQGHDVLQLADTICDLNNAPLMPVTVIAPLGDMRKVAVANRKKSVHRVFWSMSTRAQIDLRRSGKLHSIMASSTNIHYSLLITIAVAQTHYILASIKMPSSRRKIFVHIDQESATHLRLESMVSRDPTDPLHVRGTPANERTNRRGQLQSVRRALVNETMTNIESVINDLKDNMIAGRLSMLADIKLIQGGLDIADPIRFALVWSVISRIESVIRSTVGSAGVSSMKIASASIEGIPAKLVDMAAIYRSYMHCRKSDIANYLKGRINTNPLTESTADDTIYAMDQLGLQHSVTLQSLISRESGEKYLAMCAAQTVGLVYYSMEVNSTNRLSPIMTQARCNAIGRTIDSLISQRFDDKADSPQSDVIKLNMMIIRGCLRPSVHRNIPYNPRVAISWIAWFMAIMNEHCFMMGVANVYVNRRRRDKLRNLAHLLDDPEQLLSELMEGPYSLVKPQIGDLKSFHMAKAFCFKLLSWNQMDHVTFELNGNSAAAHQTYIWVNHIQPGLLPVRTISYSNLNAALDSYSYLPPTGGQNPDHLGERVAAAMEVLGEGGSPIEFLQFEPSRVYRRRAGELTGLDIKFFSQLFRNEMLQAALAYSLAMPLLLATGKTGYTDIIDTRFIHRPALLREFSDRLAEVSLPRALGHNDVPLFIIIGQAEVDLIESVNAIYRAHQNDYMLVIEIPPGASYVSLGIIYKLTLGRESHVSVALSSDFTGVSLYITTYGRPSLEEASLRIYREGNHIQNLGCDSVREYIDMIIGGHTEFLPALSITPLLQAGIAVGMDVTFSGVTSSVEVSEELLDRNKVSFIESSKSSADIVTISSLPSEAIANMIRSLKIRRSSTPPVSAILASGSHHFAGVFGKNNPEDLLNFLTDILLMLDNDDDRERFLFLIVDCMNNLPALAIDSTPLRAQMLEADLPYLVIRQMRIRSGLTRRARVLVGNYSPSPDFEDNPNPLIELFNIAVGLPSIESILAAIQMMRDSDSEEEEEGGRVNLNPAPDARLGRLAQGLLANRRQQVPQWGDGGRGRGQGQQRLPDIVDILFGGAPPGPEEEPPGNIMDDLGTLVGIMLSEAGYPNEDIDLIIAEGDDYLRSIVNLKGMELHRAVHEKLATLQHYEERQGGVL